MTRGGGRVRTNGREGRRERGVGKESDGERMEERKGRYGEI